MLQVAQPDPRPDLEMNDVYRNLGQAFARGILEAVGNPDRGDELGEWAREPREKLGDIARRLERFAVR
jgi:hypothetical protein